MAQKITVPVSTKAAQKFLKDPDLRPMIDQVLSTAKKLSWPTMAILAGASLFHPDAGIRGLGKLAVIIMLAQGMIGLVIKARKIGFINKRRRHAELPIHTVDIGLN